MHIKRRLTKQRKLVYDCVMSCGFHPTAEEVYNMLFDDNPNLSLATVYRNLNLLYSMGEIGRIAISSFAYRYDAKLDKHHHFICNDCSNVLDLDLDLDLDFSYFANKNLQVDGFDLNFSGVCSNCSNSNS